MSASNAQQTGEFELSIKAPDGRVYARNFTLDREMSIPTGVEVALDALTTILYPVQVQLGLAINRHHADLDRLLGRVQALTEDVAQLKAVAS